MEAWRATAEAALVVGNWTHSSLHQCAEYPELLRCAAVDAAARLEQRVLVRAALVPVHRVKRPRVSHSPVVA